MASACVPKILIVDDEPDIRAYVASYLQKRYVVEVSEAADGEAAITRARSFGPDLMLLDIRMLKFNGWEVVKEVRKFNVTVKIIIITGQETIGEEERVLVREHVAAFLHKPLILEEVVRKVIEVLGPDAGLKEVAAPAQSRKGRAEARAIVHALANIHSRIRMKCEHFVSNLEEGYLKEKTEAELLKESVEIMKDIAAAVDEAGPKIDEIREL